jgi:AcrR family transcriptional regulator
MKRKRRRRAGRPRTAVIDRERILAAGLELLEAGGLERATMRAIARRLRVDPMALYHYFRDRDALLRAAADHAYARLAPRRARGWRARLEALAVAYTRLLYRSGELLRYLTRRATAARGPTERFAALFHDAVAPLCLPRARAQLAHDTFVDFLHGFALGRPVPRARLRAELTVMFAGIRALSHTRPR